MDDNVKVSCEDMLPNASTRDEAVTDVCDWVKSMTRAFGLAIGTTNCTSESGTALDEEDDDDEDDGAFVALDFVLLAVPTITWLPAVRSCCGGATTFAEYMKRPMASVWSTICASRSNHFDSAFAPIPTWGKSWWGNRATQQPGQV